MKNVDEHEHNIPPIPTNHITKLPNQLNRNSIRLLQTAKSTEFLPDNSEIARVLCVCVCVCVWTKKRGLNYKIEQNLMILAVVRSSILINFGHKLIKIDDLSTTKTIQIGGAEIIDFEN